jgi:hypothetical protein
MTRAAVVRPRSVGYPGYSVTMVRAPAAAQEAAVMVRVVMAAWGLDHAADDAARLLAELVANAVRHTQGPGVRVTVDRPAVDRVYLAVADREPHRLPEMRTPHTAEATPRGLRLVDDVSDRWGYDLLGGTRPWGKRVWAELAVIT